MIEQPSVPTTGTGSDASLRLIAGDLGNIGTRVYLEYRRIYLETYPVRL
jgi:hypothetical protein